MTLIFFKVPQLYFHTVLHQENEHIKICHPGSSGQNPFHTPLATYQPPLLLSTYDPVWKRLKDPKSLSWPRGSPEEREELVLVGITWLCC